MSIDCQMENPFEQAQPPQLPQGENIIIKEMANAHAKFIDNAKQKVNKESFLAPLKRIHKKKIWKFIRMSP